MMHFSELKLSYFKKNKDTKNQIVILIETIRFLWIKFAINLPENDKKCIFIFIFR